MARDFQTFLNQLEASGELKRIAVEVDPYLEAGAIADRFPSNLAVAARSASNGSRAPPCRWS